MPEDNYDEEDVINILAEQVELNLKYRKLCGDQSKRNKCITGRQKTIPNTKLSIKRTNHNQLERSRTKTT